MDFTHQKITFCSEIILQLKNKFKMKQNEKITVIQKGETQMNITKYFAKDYKGKKKSLQENKQEHNPCAVRHGFSEEVTMLLRRNGCAGANW